MQKPSRPPPAASTGVIFAEGGGLNLEKPSGREFFAAMMKHGGKAKAVFLGAVPLERDERIDALKTMGVANVVSLVIDESTADLQDTYDQIADASIVFIRGGDQGRYVKWWKGKRTEAAVRAVFSRAGAIGGTSAGCAVLGEFTYSAENNSLSPQEALSNPHHEDLTLVRGFLGFVPGVLFDTHFTERGRIGRLPVLLARCRELGGEPLGIGMDPRTAAVVRPDGSMAIVGEHAATLVHLTSHSRIDLRPGVPPTVSDMRCSRLLPGTHAAIPHGDVTGRPEFVKPKSHADLVEETAFEALTIDGSVDEHASLGVLRIAMREGEPPAVTTGAGRLPASIVLPNAFERETWARHAACLRAASGEPHLLAWLLTPGCRIEVSDRGMARVTPDSTASAVIIDTHTVTHAGAPAHGDPSRPPSHFEYATLHVIGPGWAFDVRTRAVIAP